MVKKENKKQFDKQNQQKNLNKIKYKYKNWNVKKYLHKAGLKWNV